MANEEHVALLMQGVAAWNAWREENPDIFPDLSGANLRRTNLIGAKLQHPNLSGAKLIEAELQHAKLSGTNLIEADLAGTKLIEADLIGADLSSADLIGANLIGADLSGANLSAADLSTANLVRVDLTGADLTGCRIYGISAWELKLEGAKQENLVITPPYNPDIPDITVDNIEVAQFIYLLLHNEKIRDVIETIGRKGVLLLGRFTEGRIAILERLQEELRKRDYLPIVFNFDKPETKDFTETVRLLAGLSHFIIADVTNPRSTPLELQATVPECMVPFLPIIAEGEEPFAMLTDLWIKHRDWVFEPIHYSSLDALVKALDKEIIGPAEARFDELVARKAEKMKGKHV
jgi:Pentapeptide repeats (8 copies)